MRYISRIMQEINQLVDKETKQKMHAIYLAESWQEINHQVDKETKQSKKCMQILGILGRKQAGYQPVRELRIKAEKGRQLQAGNKTGRRQQIKHKSRRNKSMNFTMIKVNRRTGTPFQESQELGMLYKVRTSSAYPRVPQWDEFRSSIGYISMFH